jgi:trans-L-3-hydroxyproline dehydratase
MNTLTVIDMHTGGEPLRIVTGGYPPLPKGTILEKRAYVRDNLDHLRKILMFEPRGHYDMYGALLVEPDLPGADLAVLFMHNEGYSTMCGHAILALGRYAVDKGLVAKAEPVTRIGIEAPCGLVIADIAVEDGKSGDVSFESVPSFLFAGDLAIDLPGYGAIRYDIAYGGAFYALADCRQFGLAFGRDPVRRFTDAADALTQAVKKAVPLSHPDADDLAFLYGTILTDGGDGKFAPSKNVCVFADREVDRSPTGSGVTARMAAFAAKGTVANGETRTFESITGARFSAALASNKKVGAYQAVTVRVSGRAHYCGQASFIVEEDDPLGGGFLVR